MHVTYFNLKRKRRSKVVWTHTWTRRDHHDSSDSRKKKLDKIHRFTN